MTIQEQLDSFNAFVAKQVHNGDNQLTMDELYDQWRIENPTDKELEENVAAVKAALKDYQEGDRGIPHEEHMRQLEEELDTPS